MGTSATVVPAAWLLGLAAGAGAVTAEVDVEAASPDVDHRLLGSAGEVLPRLVRSAFGEDAVR